jgi:hypothetical protein
VRVEQKPGLHSTIETEIRLFCVSFGYLLEIESLRMYNRVSNGSRMRLLYKWIAISG